MRHLLASIAVLVSAGACAVPRKSAEMSEWAYASGCLDAYRSICAKFMERDEGLAASCREDGLDLCEDNGKRFKSWVTGDGPKPVPLEPAGSPAPQR